MKNILYLFNQNKNIMNYGKNFYDKSSPSGTKNLLTSITGILLMLVSLVASVLLVTGKIEQNQVEPLSQLLTNIITIGGQLIGYISALILMFKAKDA